MALCAAGFRLGQSPQVVDEGAFCFGLGQVVGGELAEVGCAVEEGAGDAAFLVPDAQVMVIAVDQAMHLQDLIGEIGGAFAVQGLVEQPVRPAVAAGVTAVCVKP